MKKTNNVFFCNNCGHESVKWLGKCPSCDSWNSFEEQIINKNHNSKRKNIISAESLYNIPITNTYRIKSDISELDILLGGGIVPGSAILIGGEPGIGKSTILLQIAKTTSAKNLKILYISAEESLSQTKLRAQRIKVTSKDVYILASGDLDNIKESLKKINPDILIIDSIQAIFTSELTSSPGSLSQVRECANSLIEQTKNNNTALFLTGHVTKDGTLAGPKILEHMVDTVLYFEGSRDKEIRIIRSVKNRFGSINEIGVFMMTEHGLQEIHDPTGIFIESKSQSGPGACLTATLEGNRVLLAEIQGLVTDSVFNNISRTIDGIEPNRVLRIKAIISHRLGLQIADKDIFINVTGGLNIYEPAVDLPVALSIASSFNSKEIDKNTIFLGEISLLGELRKISHPEKRILQAKKLGIKTAILPLSNKDDIDKIPGINIIYINTLKEAFELVF